MNTRSYGLQAVAGALRRFWGAACPVLALALAPLLSSVAAETIELEAKDTLTPLEMERADELRFRLRGGRVFTMVLERTGARIIERVTPGGIIYQLSAHVRVDGQPMTLERYVCCQECFCEPYVIDGVRIWLDTVKDVFDLVPIRYPRKGNRQCLPRKSARFALQDARQRICPQETHPWIADERNFIDVGECYNGDDSYLGPYLGQACHVGLDINHAKGSPLFAPIDIDTQAYFNSLEMGHNNNRWRGVRRWANGEVWALQSHHLIELLVPQSTPLKAGARYATTAGVHVGSHEHTHFEFKIGRPRKARAGLSAATDASSIASPIDFDDESAAAQSHPEVLHLDPWIVFWQIFEDRKARRGEIRAAMEPARPAEIGRRATFSARRSRAGAAGRSMAYYWTFGDGGLERGAEVSHVFARPGVYPVTLVVDDGVERARFTQHVSVSGEALVRPVLTLFAPDEPAFRARPVPALDVYGRPVRSIPHTVSFVARSSRPQPRPRTVHLRNIGGGVLPRASAPEVDYEGARGWLEVTLEGSGNDQRLSVGADAGRLPPGTYAASVSIASSGAIGSPQAFRVELRVPSDPPSSEVTVDDRDPGFYATPYFWVGHRFCRSRRGRRGHRGFYLTNGGRPNVGEYVRFTPDLTAGRYEVSLSRETPFRAGAEFDALVRHRGGEKTVRIRPEHSRTIGRFEFDEGMDGYVEIRAGNSKGLVMADAVRFERTGSLEESKPPRASTDLPGERKN